MHPEKKFLFELMSERLKHREMKTQEATYLIINLDAFSWRNYTPDNASIYRSVLKALPWRFLLWVIFINVTVQGWWRPWVVLFVRARQTAAIRLGCRRAIIINYIIVIVIDLRLKGRFRALAFITVALVLRTVRDFHFIDAKIKQILVTALQTNK